MIVVAVYELVDDFLNQLYLYKGVHPKESSFRLLKDIERAFCSADIQKPDIIIANKGPGSFTGIRICVATARNLAQLWKIPVIGFDCLEIYSSYYFSKYFAPALVIIDGKQKKVYTGYHNSYGFKGSFDIKPEEINQYFELSSNVKIYTDYDYDRVHFNIKEDIPEPKFLLDIQKVNIAGININSYNYKNMLPNYMRGTYAD